MIVPLPLPLSVAPEIQLESSPADQLQPLSVEMLKLPEPPSASNGLLEGEIEYEQFAPDCVTVCVLPPTVISPVRVLVPLLLETLYCTVPLPLPLPDVIVIQLALSLADQLQPLGADTLKLPDPPLELKLLLDGEIE